MLKKIIIILAIVIVAIVGIVVFRNLNKTEDTGLTKIRLNEVTRSVFYAPQYVAISQGFFEKEGLEIEITTGQGADKVMTAVLAGQSDIGFAGPEASIYVYNEGKEDYTEVFAQMTKKDGSFLVSKTENKEFKWTDLKGTTVIPGRKGGVPYMALEYVIKKNGMNPQTDMVLDDSIKFDLMAGAFAGGNAEYVTLFEPTASMTEAAGKGYIVAAVGEAAGEIPYTAYFAKKSYIEANSEIIQKFTNAVYEGQKWVSTHSAKEIAEVVVEFFPDTDLGMLEKSIQSYIDIDAWNDTPVMTEESFELLQTVMTEAGELSQKAPYDKVINNKYAENAIK
ncbi:MAG: ABC transporter substrate-binding protein [Clostridia bacterium]|nr:ABC transporter substrate-binding protein [Clostridia bacterium]